MSGITLVGLFSSIVNFLSNIFMMLPFFGVTSPEKLAESKIVLFIGALLVIIVFSYGVVKWLIQRDKISIISQDSSNVPNDTIDISRLPRPSTELVGRINELTQLTNALTNEKVYVAYIWAGGGVGKSALAFTWLQNMQPDYHGVKKVFAWSFYSQGSHDTQNSSVPFFQVALPFFGFVGDIPKDDVDKGRALAKCLRNQSFILVLDGLEPLQHPSYILDGELKDVAIKEFLTEVHFYGLSQKMSLVVISSRQPLVESDAWSKNRYITIELQTLSNEDGRVLLDKLGVKGKREELEQASGDMGGHALALVLLGKMLVSQFVGKIERRDQLPPLSADAKLGGHALRVLRWYEQYWKTPFWLALLLKIPGTSFLRRWESKERNFLNLLSLFDRPMGLAEKDVLVKKAQCTAPLRALTDMNWLRLEKTLENASLLLRSEGERTYWDCHPLIRDHFSQCFQKTQPESFRQAHLVLFEYYQSVVSIEQQPNTVEELDPLYQAVVHGCLAGEYYKAGYDVYWLRILREKKYYSQENLGAYSRDLTVLAAFFPHGWARPVEHGLTEINQAWLLGMASSCLMSLGRLTEAVEPRQVCLKLYENMENWRAAARTAQHLVDLMMPLGRLAEAEQLAQQAITYANQSKDLSKQMTSHAYLATVHHRQGKFASAIEAFKIAEQFQNQWEPDSSIMYSFCGFRYCSLLLETTDEVDDVNKVLERGQYILTKAQTKEKSFDISLGYLTLARAHFKLGQMEQTATYFDQAAIYFDQAATYFDQAVAGIHKAGKIDRTPPFSIGRARFYLRQQRVEEAQRDLEEARQIIHRSGMKLYEVDYHLVMCEYYHLTKQFSESKHHLSEAKRLINNVTGYYSRNIQVAELEAMLLILE